MNFSIEFERENDGRWIAEIPQLPGVMVYGATRDEAQSRVEALALRVLADQIEDSALQVESISFAAA
ncbi:MAG TPA: type II toxin-antitoxin system HicB family antitoxin [Acidobacteriaceae bacterium]|nr:type II toxin-antitoxin system HicB family antitoxin [Acidobacteriaceae bacterium]